MTGDGVEAPPGGAPGRSERRGSSECPSDYEVRADLARTLASSGSPWQAELSMDRAPPSVVIRASAEDGVGHGTADVVYRATLDGSLTENRLAELRAELLHLWSSRAPTTGLSSEPATIWCARS